ESLGSIGCMEPMGTKRNPSLILPLSTVAAIYTVVASSSSSAHAASSSSSSSSSRSNDSGAAASSFASSSHIHNRHLFFFFFLQIERPLHDTSTALAQIAWFWRSICLRQR
ncbi:hypothetical protein PIB30_080575, partial [Stylosanthes scabra]|nr:hypothetical protein [Stylosanthes scabra]